MLSRKIGTVFALLVSLVTAPKLLADEANTKQLLFAARDGNVLQTLALLAQGLSPNVSDDVGITPLFLAAYHGHIHVMNALKEAGADTCALDHKGSNAMMGAASRGRINVIKWMLEHGDCNINQQNYAGQTALVIAASFRHDEIIDLLLEYGADSMLRDARGNTAASLAIAHGRHALADKL